MQSFAKCTPVISAVYILLQSWQSVGHLLLLPSLVKPKALLSELLMYRKLRTNHIFQRIHSAIAILRLFICISGVKKKHLFASLWTCLALQNGLNDDEINQCVWMSACDYI